MDDLKLTRNIGIIAHIDAGKTSTTEAMLYYSGRSHKIGSIDDGSTVMDYLDEERQRGITIVAAAASFPWKTSLIHLIDTPGHIDFTAEVERSLRVIDGAVVIFSAVEGVEAQSEKVWRQADRYHVPKIAFINKLDRIGASFPRVYEEINEKFGNCAIALQEPIGIEGDFKRVIDLITMELCIFSGDNNENVVREAIPDEFQELAEEKRSAMIEKLADFCDDIAMMYLEGEVLEAAFLIEKIREMTIGNKIVPVMCGSAKNRLGVQPLMNAVIDYLPSPLDVPEMKAVHTHTEKQVDIGPDEKAAFTGLIFKVVAGTSADLLYMRTYSGKLKAGDTYVNARTGSKVRVKQILRLYAKNTQSVDEVGPGDIVGLIGPRDCGTGDSICDKKQVVSFEQITFPEPVISVAVEPRYTKEKDKLDEALKLLCREDPTLEVQKDKETGQRLLSGMGELHLEINLKRLLSEFKAEAKVGEPRVAFRETLQSAKVVSFTFEKLLGDTELFAAAKVAFKPISSGGDSFVIKTSCKKGAQIPGKFIHSAEETLISGLKTGGLRGYPLIYVEADIMELTIDPAKTNEGAVAGAILSAINQAITEIGTKILEPVMHLEIMSPDDTVGEIVNYLHPRRAVIHEMEAVGTVKKIRCEVPLAEMFGFGKSLPKLSGGRAAFSMEPCGYQELPKEAADKMFGYI